MLHRNRQLNDALAHTSLIKKKNHAMNFEKWIYTHRFFGEVSIAEDAISDLYIRWAGCPATAGSKYDISPPRL